MQNNPIRFNDPTGHRCVPEDECSGGLKPKRTLIIPKKIENFKDIKDDPVELIARAILGEEA